MATFSARSKNKLSQCHPDLQNLMNAAIEHYNFTVLCGHRGQEEQDAAYSKGTSKLKYPMSKHNKIPSLAVDIAPYPIEWRNTYKFEVLAHIVKGLAKEMNIDIVWGGDWKTFKDYPHYELK